MSVNIERNVRQRLGARGQPLPAAVTVDDDGVLW
jgi:hypothetical protein